MGMVAYDPYIKRNHPNKSLHRTQLLFDTAEEEELVVSR
jgi:hypothetical protein